jgi:hypothetical protein
MRRFSYVVAALAIATAAPLAVMPALAQQMPEQNDTQAAEPTTSAVGLPIYTSDGEHLGEVVQVISFADQPALRAEIGNFLGIGTTTAVIPANMFQRKPDRIELSMTAAEVRNTVEKQR